MMDASEISECVRHEKKPRLDGETQPLSPTSPSMVAVTKVLDDDNLLREIIFRVGFPTTLVRAALVCKRWLGHASDPAVLRRFRKLHPPRLLGFYISQVFSDSDPRFVPILPQPAELATVMSRLAGYRFGAHRIMHCQGGSFFTTRGEGTRLTQGVHRPLCSEKGMKVFPPPPRLQDYEVLGAILSKEEANGLSYLYVVGESTGEAGKSTARVYMLQDGVWSLRTTATCLHRLHFNAKAVLVGNKIYMPSGSGSSDDIIVLDMTTSSFSTIQLPQGVRYGNSKTMLSGADDASGVYLMHVMKFQLHIWLHKGANWLLIDTICLNEMPILGMPDHTLQRWGIADVVISHVGDNAQFVFLRMCHCIVYLDIKSRTVCKVHTLNDLYYANVHPFMITPTFPALKRNHARDAM